MLFIMTIRQRIAWTAVLLVLVGFPVTCFARQAPISHTGGTPTLDLGGLRLDNVGRKACESRGMFYQPGSVMADLDGCISALPHCVEGAFLQVHNGGWRCYTLYSMVCGNNAGQPVFCNDGDTRVSCTDSGHGSDHWITLVGDNGCVAHEGAVNHGTVGCMMTCKTLE